MHIYNRWRIVFIVETLLIVFSLVFLAKQSWGANSTEHLNRFGPVGWVTTHPDNGGVTLRSS